MSRQAQDQTNRQLTLADCVQRLARSRTERALATALLAGVRALLGADDAILLSRAARPEPALPDFPSGVPEPTPLVREAPAALKRAIEDGEATTLVPTDPRLDGLELPPGVTGVEVVPCSGPGSTAALCLLPAEPGGPGRAAEAAVLAAVAGSVLDRLDAERRDVGQRARLQNRLRNLVAVVRSVSHRSAGPARSLQDYVMHFEGRLDALLRAEMALARGPGDGLDFEDLLRDELLAEGIQDGPRVELGGLPVMLVAAEADALGLAIHELAVNAWKFGPFTERGGSLSVRWWAEWVADRVVLRLDWREDCKKALTRSPERVGFGRDFLERAIPYELGGETELAISPRGAFCRIRLPLARPPVAA